MFMLFKIIYIDKHLNSEMIHSFWLVIYISILKTPVMQGTLHMSSISDGMVYGKSPSIYGHVYF